MHLNSTREAPINRPEPLAFISATAPPFDPDALAPAFRYAPL